MAFRNRAIPNVHVPETIVSKNVKLFDSNLRDEIRKEAEKTPKIIQMINDVTHKCEEHDVELKKLVENDSKHLEKINNLKDLFSQLLDKCKDLENVIVDNNQTITDLYGLYKKISPN